MDLAKAMLKQMSSITSLNVEQCRHLVQQLVVKFHISVSDEVSLCL